MGPRSVEEVRARLYEAAAQPDGDLAAAALWIAAEEYPDLDVPRYLAFLEERADAVARSVGAETDLESWRRRLGEELFERHGFRGDEIEYDAPRNSYLNAVIDRRRGLPISLSIVWLAVGSRLDLPVAGVDAPGHFLVRMGPSIVDPFRSGRPWTAAELEEHLGRLGEAVPSRRRALLLSRPPSLREILVRVLVNLRQSYLRRRDLPRALAAVDRLVHLDRSSARWLRERAAIYQHLGCASAAADDIERYLEREPADPEADALRRVVVELRRRCETLH